MIFKKHVRIVGIAVRVHCHRVCLVDVTSLLLQGVSNKLRVVGSSACYGEINVLISVMCLNRECHVSSRIFNILCILNYY